MNNSSSSDFLLWGSEAGIPTFVLQDLIEFAATPEQFRYAINEMLPPPPIYPVDEIRTMHDKDPMGINHFLMVAGKMPLDSFGAYCASAALQIIVELLLLYGFKKKEKIN